MARKDFEQRFVKAREAFERAYSEIYSALHDALEQEAMDNAEEGDEIDVDEEFESLDEYEGDLSLILDKMQDEVSRLMHRPTKRNRSVVGHRKDLQAAHRRMYEAYERAKTPAARRKIMARIRAIEREMERRDGYE